jgi:hypothetical protein
MSAGYAAGMQPVRHRLAMQRTQPTGPPISAGERLLRDALPAEVWANQRAATLETLRGTTQRLMRRVTIGGREIIIDGSPPPCSKDMASEASTFLDLVGRIRQAPTAQSGPSIAENDVKAAREAWLFRQADPARYDRLLAVAGDPMYAGALLQLHDRVPPRYRDWALTHLENSNEPARCAKMARHTFGAALGWHAAEVDLWMLLQLLEPQQSPQDAVRLYGDSQPWLEKFHREHTRFDDATMLSMAQACRDAGDSPSTGFRKFQTLYNHILTSVLGIATLEITQQLATHGTALGRGAGESLPDLAQRLLRAPIEDKTLPPHMADTWLQSLINGVGRGQSPQHAMGANGAFLRRCWDHLGPMFGPREEMAQLLLDGFDDPEQARHAADLTFSLWHRQLKGNELCAQVQVAMRHGRDGEDIDHLLARLDESRELTGSFEGFERGVQQVAGLQAAGHIAAGPADDMLRAQLLRLRALGTPAGECVDKALAALQQQPSQQAGRIVSEQGGLRIGGVWVPRRP